MPDELTRDERLLLPIVRAADEAAQAGAPTTHPDDELLALFAEGALADGEREELVRHLDVCASCRRAAGLLLSWEGAAGQLAEDGLGRPIHGQTRRTFWQLPNRAAVYVLAASLLLAVGLLYLGFQAGDPQLAERRAYERAGALLAANQFAEARELLADAEKRGITSDRLRSLQSQAVRELPGPLALAFAGRLSDFGYEPGGIVARETAEGKLGRGLKPGYELLQKAGTEELEAVLNRGHALLALRRPGEALAAFQRATELAPKEPLARLGRGLAQFMLDDDAAAERDFRECLRLDGASVAAKMNLALTLEELDRREQALAIWQGLLSGNLTEADRAFAGRAVRQLKEQ